MAQDFPARSIALGLSTCALQGLLVQLVKLSTHTSKAVELILTPSGIMVLLNSFLGWLLKESRGLQSYRCWQLFSKYPLSPGAKSTFHRAIRSQKQ